MKHLSVASKGIRTWRIWASANVAEISIFQHLSVSAKSISFALTGVCKSEMCSIIRNVMGFSLRGFKNAFLKSVLISFEFRLRQETPTEIFAWWKLSRSRMWKVMIRKISIIIKYHKLRTSTTCVWCGIMSLDVRVSEWNASMLQGNGKH